MLNQKYYYKELRCYNCGHTQEYKIPLGVEWSRYMNGDGIDSWADGPTCPKCGCRDYYEPLQLDKKPFLNDYPSQEEIDNIIWSANTISQAFRQNTYV